jgi:hypothetical protein
MSTHAKHFVTASEIQVSGCGTWDHPIAICVDDAVAAQALSRVIVDPPYVGGAATPAGAAPAAPA